MDRIELRGEDLADLLGVQVRTWRDWPARFSCNPRGDVWATPSLGHSAVVDRIPLGGAFPILDQAVDLVLSKRERGGRMFLCEHGVFSYRDDLGCKVQLARFVLPSDPDLRMRCSGHRITIPTNR